MDNYIKMQIVSNLYKRGFILAKSSDRFPEVTNSWARLDLPDNFVIAYENGNKCAFQSFNGGWLCLCGSYCMDVIAGNMNFDSISHNLAKKLSLSKNEFLNYLDILNGRFVCIYSVNGNIFALNDATGTRSVYYCLSRPVMASHYNLLNDIVCSEPEPFYEKYMEVVKKKVSEHKSYPWVMPGDLTPFKDIRILVPNHEIDFATMTSSRFWPRAKMPDVNIDSVCDEIAILIGRQAEVLSDNYRIIESLTAGTDARITLAAVRNIADKVTFFTYHNPVQKVGEYETNDREENFLFAKNLCKKENLNFYEINFTEEQIPADLTKLYRLNHYHIHLPQLLPHYIKLFTQGSIHLRSNLIEIIRSNHVPTNLFVSENDIRLFVQYMNWNPNDMYYNEACNIYFKFFSEYKDNIYDYSGSHLAYWEHRLGSWLSSAVLTISDFSCDTFQLFNCRYIMGIGMSLPMYFKNRSIIYDGILKRLWPDLLDYGIPNNPKRLYDLIDKNPTSLFSLENRVKTFHGNLYIPNRNCNALFELRHSGATIAFSDNSLKKGDYCGIETSLNVKNGISYALQFLLKTQWFNNLNQNNINYEILIDDSVVYSLCTTDYFSVNQIMYCFKAIEDKKLNIKVRLLAKKDISSQLYCGILDIIILDLRQDFAHEYAEQAKIIDTYSGLQAIKQ